MHADQWVMTNEQFTEAVEEQEYPALTEVPIDHAFKDERGVISNLLLTPITSVARIESKRGAVRANHWHRTDWHFAYVVSGKVLYFERAIGDTTVSAPQTFLPGQMFFTPPMREHAMLFAEDTVIMTFAKNVRSHDNHEADLVRVEYVTPEVIAKYVP
jgi:dTDP-4-dehydrorhamnose 3,5-epimerase-like enzyme